MLFENNNYTNYIKTGSRDHITSLAIGCFACVKGLGPIVGPIIAASLHHEDDYAQTAYGGFGFRDVEIFVGKFIFVFSFHGYGF